jgi:GAF domain-containing protein/HAMP domain-containing protein
VARRVVRRGNLEATGYWILAATLVAFIPGELLWANQTVYFVLSVLLLLGLVGNTIRPRRWWLWAGAAVLYVAVAILINRLEASLPFERYLIDQNPAMRYTVPSIAALLVLVILVQFVLAYRHLSTIRGRLLVSFVVIGVVPVIAIALIGVAFAWRSGQRNAQERVDLAATFVNAEIDAWVESLRDGLGESLTKEDAIRYARQVLGPAATGSEDVGLGATYRGMLLRAMEDYVTQTSLLDGLFLMDTGGRVILSSGDEETGQVYGTQPFFLHGLAEFSLQSSFRAAPGGPPVVVAAIPVLDEQDRVIGVLAGRASETGLNDIVSRPIGVGETGEAYLVDEDGRAITALRTKVANVLVSTEGARAALDGQSGTLVYDNYGGTPVVGAYRWLPELGVALLVEQSQAETAGTVTAMTIANASIALIVAAISVVVALRITRSIADPLADLAQTAGQVSDGNLAFVAEVGRADEVGALAGAFNRMTRQLRELVGGLEQRVTERTSDLERRSFYLDAAAQVARTASSILDPERLFRVIVELIREQFELSYVGLFLVSEGSQWAELRAGTGEAGRHSLDDDRRVWVGDDQSIVGRAIQYAQAQSVSEAGPSEGVGQPKLPDTRSEAALPLRSRGRVLGALTVHSDQPDAFGQELLGVLQTMADQVAVAVDNARLFEEGQAALVAARRASGDLSQAAWAEILRARANLGFRSDERGVERAYDVWRPEMEQAMRDAAPSTDIVERADQSDRVLAVPIRMQGEVIGVLDLRKPDEAGAWTLAQIDLAEQISEQLSQALENARLYEETQRRGIREQQLREIGTRMQSTVDLDAILRTAIEDLAKALDVPSAFVQLYEGRPRTEE